MKVRLWFALALLCAATMPARGEAGGNPLVGHWFVEAAYGNRQFLSQENARDVITDALTSLERKQMFRIEANRVVVLLKDYGQVCDLRTVTDLGDVARQLDQLFPGSGGVDFISRSGEETNSSLLSGELYDVRVGRCSGGPGWFHPPPAVNYVIRSGQNLFVFTAFALLKLSRD